MRKNVRRAVLLAVNFLLLASVATAQNNRSAVSVTGNDAASCTVPDPCRTFAVALSKTNSNGEVVALTSGGYGPFTINKPATFVAAPGSTRPWSTPIPREVRFSLMPVPVRKW